MARPQRVLPRRRQGVPYIFHQQPRRRGDGECLELPRHHAARPSGDLGGLARGLSPDPAIQVVELARQLRRRAHASPEVGRYHNRPSSSGRPKARARGESELEKGDHFVHSSSLHGRVAFSSLILASVPRLIRDLRAWLGRRLNLSGDVRIFSICHPGRCYDQAVRPLAGRYEDVGAIRNRFDDPFSGRQPTSHERKWGQPWDASYHGGPAPWDIGRPQPAVVRVASETGFARAVLDAGCGTGENALHIASLGFSEGLSVLGIDVAETALAIARDKARERGIEA